MKSYFQFLSVHRGYSNGGAGALARARGIHHSRTMLRCPREGARASMEKTGERLLRLLSYPSCLSLFLLRPQRDDEARPDLAWLNHEVAAVGAGEFPCDREADSGAGRGIGEPIREAYERFEDSLLHSGRDSRPSILDRDRDPIAHAAG